MAPEVLLAEQDKNYGEEIDIFSSRIIAQSRNGLLMQRIDRHIKAHQPRVMIHIYRTITLLIAD
jgi:hypothetical protein